ncbi:PQQ-dependent sugar dehydrogenase [Mumia sp. DW29H23]|uniref:PQQ-dependent sugar dehydrogenase n=1 Tax=Mumia sp. DW29H23 TaxID=3421241 RepID=UPI003D68175C
MTQRRWSLLAAAALVAATMTTATTAAGADDPAPPAPLTDPLPEPVLADFGLVVEEVAQFPKSDPVPAPTDPRLMRHARINYLGEIPDGSDRLYVPDLNGTLYFMAGGGKHGTIGQPYPYLDVRAKVGADFFASAGMGSGFGFVTFHPEFRTNGTFYTVHTEAYGALQTKTPDLTPQPNTAFHGVITEWTADDPKANTFTGTHREVLRLGFATRIHGIQQIEFNPTAEPGDEDYGLLYVAAGDGGIGVNTDEPQTLSTPQGKLLRIDPAGTDSDNGEYGIPASNPFVGTAGAIGEIYAYGFRDPHRFSWDTGGDNRLLLGHIGEKDVEAIYDIKAGDNSGWSEREGSFLYDKNDRCNLYPLPEGDEENGYNYPVAQYDHNPPPGLACGADVGHAVSGGFVYRGKDVPRLKDKYLFADLVDGRVMYTEDDEMVRGEAAAQIHELTLFDRDGNEVTAPVLAGDRRVDLRLGRDGDNELYLLAKANGKVWKIVGTKKVKDDRDVHPALSPYVVAHYDFERPNGDVEADRGPSGTAIDLINGGSDLRVKDGAFAASKRSIQLREADPAAGELPWKAGVYEDDADGVESLSRFNAAKGITVMGWVKMTGDGPSLNTNTPDPNDRYNAIGLAGVLSGNSDGHGVRALLELIDVNGELRLVALGRRVDTGNSQTFAASEDWRTLLPQGEWVHLAATFNYANGTMALYKNGRPIPGFYTRTDDPWGNNAPGEEVTSATNPRGIKIGGSFPQNGSERNPCNCRMDSLMFLDSSLTKLEVNQQYRRVQD